MELTHSVYTRREALGILARLIWKEILRGGPKHIGWFVRTLPLRRPSAMATVISESIVALSMCDFAEGRLASATTSSCAFSESDPEWR